MKIKNVIGHLKTIHIHRKWVRYYCFKAGLYKQGLSHDLSKYSPTEFWESVKYYSGTSSPIDECKKDKGYSDAWLHHRGRNKHHYEYWQDNFDYGGEALPMPYKYALELVCDYLAAGVTYMKENFTYEAEYEWWRRRIEKPIAMHPATQYFVTEMLKELAFYESITPITGSHLRTCLRHNALGKWCKGYSKYRNWRKEDGSKTED